MGKCAFYAGAAPVKAGVNLMNKTAIASLIGCLVVILPLHAEDIYIVRRFKAIESNPIPRDEYFVLLRKTVLNSFEAISWFGVLGMKRQDNDQTTN